MPRRMESRKSIWRGASRGSFKQNREVRRSLRSVIFESFLFCDSVVQRCMAGVRAAYLFLLLERVHRLYIIGNQDIRIE